MECQICFLSLFGLLSLLINVLVSNEIFPQKAKPTTKKIRSELNLLWHEMQTFHIRTDGKDGDSVKSDEEESGER